MQKAGKIESTLRERNGRLRRVYGVPSALCVMFILVAAAGAPLAQLLRVAEVTPVAAEGKSEALQYRLVLAGVYETPAAKTTPQAQTAEGTQKTPKAPDARLLKVLDETWDFSQRVQYESAEIPAPLDLAAPETSEPQQQRETPLFVVFSHSPPIPLARGPPL